MARIYSAQLAVANGLGGGIPANLGGPPAGAVWVVRHMTLLYEVDQSFPLNGVIINGGPPRFPLWSLRGRGLRSGSTYDWAGRHVLISGETISFDSQDPANWAITVSGYLLQGP